MYIEFQNTAMANPSTAKEEGDWAIVSFADPWHFPTCNGISPFNQGISRPSYDPALDRWCLLAEVTDTAFFFQARVMARDRDGKDFVVGFYPNNADAANLNLGQFHVGHTVALAYPKPHKFPDGLWGVRVDELDSCSVSLPLPLQLFLSSATDSRVQAVPRRSERPFSDQLGPLRLHRSQRHTQEMPSLWKARQGSHHVRRVPVV